MAERWTDERLDGLKREMDLRFDHVDNQLAQVDRRFDEVDRRIGEIVKRLDGFESRFERLDGRLYAMHRMLAVFLGSMVIGTLGLMATLFATQL